MQAREPSPVADNGLVSRGNRINSTLHPEVKEKACYLANEAQHGLLTSFHPAQTEHC